VCVSLFLWTFSFVSGVHQRLAYRPWRFFPTCALTIPEPASGRELPSKVRSRGGRENLHARASFSFISTRPARKEWKGQNGAEPWSRSRPGPLICSPDPLCASLFVMCLGTEEDQGASERRPEVTRGDKRLVGCEQFSVNQHLVDNLVLALGRAGGVCVGARV
jgi:hypothetical protein